MESRCRHDVCRGELIKSRIRIESHMVEGGRCPRCDYHYLPQLVMHRKRLCDMCKIPGELTDIRLRTMVPIRWPESWDVYMHNMQERFVSVPTAASSPLPNIDSSAGSSAQAPPAYSAIVSTSAPGASSAPPQQRGRRGPSPKAPAAKRQQRGRSPAVASSSASSVAPTASNVRACVLEASDVRTFSACL